MIYDIAAALRLVADGDDALARYLAKELDPYVPIDDVDDREPVADIRIAERGRLETSLVDVQNPAGDGRITGWDGRELTLVIASRTCTVPALATSGVLEFRYEQGFPLARVFGRIVRPAIQLAAGRNGAIATHASGVTYDGRGLIVGGWSESGKTETALALMELGAQFVSDKWTIVRPDGTIACFPISVGVRRWVLQYLPTLRRNLPSAAKSQLRVAGAAATLSRPFRRLRPSTHIGQLTIGALDRSVALVERAALHPSDLSAAYGQKPPTDTPPLGAVVMLTTVPDGKISATTADPGWAARRLARAASYERRAFFELNRRARYADPALDGWLDQEIEEAEATKLAETFAGVPLIEARAPFPTDPRRVAEAILARIEE